MLTLSGERERARDATICASLVIYYYIGVYSYMRVACYILIHMCLILWLRLQLRRLQAKEDEVASRAQELVSREKNLRAGRGAP